MKKSEKFSLKSLKSTLSENNKLTRAISVIFLILIMFGLFTFIIAGLYQFDLIPFPILNIFFKPDDNNSTTGSDNRNIYDFLTNDEPGEPDLNGGGYYLEYTLDNIKDIISNIPVPDNLYLETEAKYYTDGNITRTEEMSLWKKGDKYKYILKVNTKTEESYINDSKNELIENFQTQSRRIRAVSSAFSFDNIPHIKNINYYLNLLESGEIKLSTIYRYPESNVAHIKYSIPQLNQWEYIDISLDTGIVIKVKTRVGINDDLFYECETKVAEAYYDGDEQAASKSTIIDSFFVISE
jgi:hypothetical protein